LLAADAAGLHLVWVDVALQDALREQQPVEIMYLELSFLVPLQLQDLELQLAPLFLAAAACELYPGRVQAVQVAGAVFPKASAVP
jgi:hypothetical protein